MIVVETQFDQVLTYRRMPKITIKGKAVTMSLPDISIKNIIVATGNDTMDTLVKYEKLQNYFDENSFLLDCKECFKVSLKKGGELYA